MPFLRLTRDRRGTENTFLMHADRPGDRPRLLYWYRTAPGILLGRSPLDEDAIRTIEDQHPDIEFDWPAILALSEVMTPEEEAPAPRPPSQQQRQQQPKKRRESESPRQPPRDARGDEPAAEAGVESAPESAGDVQAEADEPESSGSNEAPAESADAAPRASGLLEELVGREISTRLRARYSEIMTRIDEQHADAATRRAWIARAEPLNPDLWVTPDAILEGVRTANNLFETLRVELLHAPRE